MKEDPESIIERLLLETAFGHIMQWVVDHGHESDMIEKYLQDFVHMVYTARTKDPKTEYQVPVYNYYYHIMGKISNLAQCLMN